LDAAVFYKDHGDSVYVRAVGHITAKLCPGLKDRIYARINADRSLKAVHVDLSQCEYMDSTFMGLLVGVRKALKAIEGAFLYLHAPDATCRDLLKSVGILALVIVTEELPEFPTLLVNTAVAEDLKPEFILNSHENLMELSEENRRRFAGLRAVLKKTIQGGNNGSEGDTKGE
jgi:anti-anti-sigma factor